MNQLQKTSKTCETWINLSLIEDFDLSDTATFSYVAILKTFQLTKYQTISPLGLVKNLFGPKAENRKLVAEGIKELIQKGAIGISYKKDKTTLYDLTPLKDYPAKRFVKDDGSFLEKFEDFNNSVGGLYRLYLNILFLISKEKYLEKTNVLKTNKTSLATLCKCSRNAISKRLEDLKKYKLIDYEAHPYFNSFDDYSTLFIVLPENQNEMIQEVEEIKRKNSSYCSENKEKIKGVNECTISDTNSYQNNDIGYWM